MQLLCASGYARQTMYVHGERVHIIAIHIYICALNNSGAAACVHSPAESAC